MPYVILFMSDHIYSGNGCFECFICSIELYIFANKKFKEKVNIEENIPHKMQFYYNMLMSFAL